MRYEVRYPSGERARWVGPSEGLYDSLTAAVIGTVDAVRAMGNGGLVIHDRFSPDIRVQVSAYHGEVKHV